MTNLFKKGILAKIATKIKLMTKTATDVIGIEKTGCRKKDGKPILRITNSKMKT